MCFNLVVCVIRYAVAAIQAQIVNVKFARCLRKCFRLRENLLEKTKSRRS